MERRPNRRTLQLTLMLGAAMMITACAVAPGMTPQEAAIRDQGSVDRFMPATREMRDNIETQELFAQAAFWSHEYELNPTDLEATLKLAAAVRKLGNPSQAVQITQTSRAIHPRDPYLLAEHAAGLIADQRALDAAPIIDQGLAIAPAYGRLWSLKGAALDQMEDYQAARQAYSRALQITPNDPNVLTNIGLSHALSGDLATAEAWIRRAAASPGAGAGVRQNLAMIMQLQGRTDEAERQSRIARLSRGDRQLPPPPVPAFSPRGVPPSAGSATAYATQQPQQLRPDGMPVTRLTTQSPDGQQFTSASQAARAMQAPNSVPMTTQSLQSGPVQSYAPIDPSAHVVGPALKTQPPQTYQAPQTYQPLAEPQPQAPRPDPAAGSGLAGAPPSGRKPARRRR